jgi:hypothetical protein
MADRRLTCFATYVESSEQTVRTILFSHWWQLDTSRDTGMYIRFP